MGFLSSIGGFISNNLGSLVGLGGSAAESALNRQAASVAFDKQSKFTREIMQNRHQWEVEDLKAAGLNPILSANNGSMIGSPSHAAPQAPSLADGLSKIASARHASKMADATERKLEAEIREIESRATVNNAHSDELFTRSMLQGEQMLNVGASTAKMQEETRQITQSIAKEANLMPYQVQDKEINLALARMRATLLALDVKYEEANRLVAWYAKKSNSAWERETNSSGFSERSKSEGSVNGKSKGDRSYSKASKGIKKGGFSLFNFDLGHAINMGTTGLIHASKVKDGSPEEILDDVLQHVRRQIMHQGNDFLKVRQLDRDNDWMFYQGEE